MQSLHNDSSNLIFLIKGSFLTIFWHHLSDSALKLALVLLNILLPFIMYFILSLELATPVEYSEALLCVHFFDSVFSLLFVCALIPPLCMQFFDSLTLAFTEPQLNRHLSQSYTVVSSQSNIDITWLSVVFPLFDDVVNSFKPFFRGVFFVINEFTLQVLCNFNVTSSCFIYKLDFKLVD